MKNIGVLNCSHIKNYGSVLQSLATERIIQRISGQNVYSLRYRQKRDCNYIKNYLRAAFDISILSFKLKGVHKRLRLSLFNKQLQIQCKQREQLFSKFVTENFNFAPEVNGLEELRESAKKYDCIVLGSDQVWHPINFGSHYYTMEWVPDSIPKITYAASFGVSTLPRYQISGTQGYLKRINDISVREERGAKIVEELIGIKPQVVVDPTLLMTADEWDDVCKPYAAEKYIFCYFLGNNEEAREFAKKIACKMDFPIYAIPYMDEVNDIDKCFADRDIFDAGPAEFLSLIKNAEYVITDSFHGTVFSIIYHKKFVVFDRFRKSGKQSTNSRIDTLLNSLQLSSRRCSDNNTEIIDREIDYLQVEHLLNGLRSDSLEYLIESLKKYGLTNRSDK